MKRLLVWLMAGQTNELRVISATVHSIAESIRKVGVHISTAGERRYESEPIVRYVKKPGPIDRLSLEPENFESSFNAKRGLQTRAQQVSYSRDHPEAMIDAMPLRRDLLNRMEMFWVKGSQAAGKIRMVAVTAESHLPFDPNSDIYYTFEDFDLSSNKFGDAEYDS